MTDHPSRTFRQNSDPLVLDGFWYSNCRQYVRRKPLRGQMTTHPSKMAALEVGSVVIFGSKFQGAWVLDAVFVVGAREEYGPSDVEPLVRDHPLLGYAAIEPLYSKRDERRDFVLYRGATASAPLHGRYSFVPAVRAAAGSFARPAVNLPKLCPNLTQGTRVLAEGEPAVQEVWTCARDQVLDAGLLLATHLHGPEFT